MTTKAPPAAASGEASKRKARAKGAAASSSEAGAATVVAASAPMIVGDDTMYTFDNAKLEELRSSKPWTDNPKYFKKVAISPSAITKMMMHCHSGVEKGVKKGGNPIEVMGLMMGRPDPAQPTMLVVTDVFPLPIEGFETRVIADDEEVVNHMIALSENMEHTRQEKFMGWYHSHPFDVGLHSHCFLSQTDLTTQLQWQRAEDPHGNPFLAVVIDPLRSLAKNVPELKAFRAYPPDYNAPHPHECPDGSTNLAEEQARLERWGSCWSRYYELQVEYYMSANARCVMSILTQNFLWMRTLGTTPYLEAETHHRYPDRVCGISERIRSLTLPQGAPDGPRALFSLVEGSPSSSAAAAASVPFAGTSAATTTTAAGSATGAGGSKKGASGGEGVVAAAAAGPPSATPPSHQDDGGEFGKACQAVIELATERLQGNITQTAKKNLFA